MKDDTTITALHQPGTILDPLTEIARAGAREMLAAALKAEAASFVAQFAEERLPDAPNLTPGVISRLTAGWQEDYDRWHRRDLSARR